VLTNLRFLVDTSTIVRLPQDDTAAVLAPVLNAGQVATCGVIELALLSLIPEPADYPEIRAIRASSFHWLETVDADWVRALDVQARLAAQGQTGIGWPELVIAAVAERHQVAVLHCHHAFPRIAAVTGQVVEWVIPPDRQP
jgi:predicted nucleic acid-binding protein